MLLDINQRKEAEEARQAAEKALEEQRLVSMRSDRLRSLGEMAAGIAHELNQPLVGVRGQAEHLLIGLKRGWKIGEPRSADMLKSIVQQADRMNHIINHVRLFAREAEKSYTSRVDVNRVATSAVSLIQEQFRSHGLDLVVEPADNLPGVLANPYSLEEALFNLIVNARQAVEARLRSDPEWKGKTVVIRTGESIRESDPLVFVEVCDRGPGFSPDILPQVFDPFFTTKGPEEGTGLGLSITKAIVERYGGRIEIMSPPGGGAVVRLYLPAAAEPSLSSPGKVWSSHVIV